MTSAKASLEINLGLNKNDSKDYQNILPWQKESAINSAVLRFFRKRIDAKEMNTKLTDDLQVLLKAPIRLSGSNKDIYFLSHKLPSDYFGYSRVTPICDKGSCTNVRIPSDLIESSNVDSFLSDYSSQPSFEFEQSFHVIGSNKIRLYHNNDFKVRELEIEYFRKPQYITLKGTPQADGGIGKDMEWEFKDDICNLIIEEAIGILSYNIENINRGQISDKNSQTIK